MGPIPLPLFGLNRTSLRESSLFSTHHYLMIWQRWRDGLEVTKHILIRKTTKALLVTVKCIGRRIDKDTGMLEVVTDIPQKLNKSQVINFLA